MILLVGLPFLAIVIVLFAIGWGAARLARHLDRLPGACRWCAVAPRPAVRNLISGPSDCTCQRPCGDIACGAASVTREEAGGA